MQKNSKQATLAETKSSSLQQVKHHQPQASKAEGILSPKNDPVNQVVCRIGDASCAGAHAAKLKRTALVQRFPKDSLLKLQRQYGNRYVQRVLDLARKADIDTGASGVEKAIQQTRAIGQTLYAKESRLINKKAVDLSGSCSDCEEEEVQSKSPAEQIMSKIQAEEEPLSEEEEQVSRIQGKLTMGSPGDVYEQEANRVAEEISSEGGLSDLSTMTSVQEKLLSSIDPHTLGGLTERSIRPKISTDSVSSKKLSVNRKQESAQQNDGSVPANIEKQILQSKGSGSPLSAHMNAYMSMQTGYDFSNVRVKSDSEAANLNRSLGARAFANGSDIWLGKGEKATDVKLMAHELTHVAQQGAAKRIQPQSNAFSQLLASKGYMPKFIQALTKNVNGNSSLFQKGILQFINKYPSSRMNTLQAQLLDGAKSDSINRRESAQTLRGSIPSCNSSSNTTCSASATGVSLGAATTINDGTIWGMSVPVIVRGAELSKVDDSEFVSTSLNHTGCFSTRPKARSSNSGWMKADSIPPDRHTSGISDHLGYFDRNGKVAGSYDRHQMDLFKIPSCGINTPQAIPNSGYRLRRKIEPVSGNKVKATITKTAIAVNFGGKSSSAGLTPERKKSTIIRN